MYNHFPDEITLFYITDSKNKILPFEEYYNYSIFDISHNYSSIKPRKSPEEIQKILRKKIEDYSKKTIPNDSIQLHIQQVKTNEWQNFQTSITKGGVCDGIKF